MENSENKSIIITGSSNLSKTEKLLSITQKILSEIKPQYKSVIIGNQEWMTRNFDVDRFQNGVLIPHVESNEEWKKAGENGQPAWCYYKNNPENGKKYGKLYNWYAVNDPCGLAPESWHVPTDEEWTSLVRFLGEEVAGFKLKAVKGWKNWRYWEDGPREIKNGNGDNSSGFNALPGGYRYYDDRFHKIREDALFWSATENDVDYAWNRILGSHGANVEKAGSVCLDFNKSYGASVRCLRD